MKRTLIALTMSAGLAAVPVANAHGPDPGAAAAAGFLGGLVGGLLLGPPPPPHRPAPVVIERYPPPPLVRYGYEDVPPRHFSHRHHRHDRDYWRRGDWDD